MCFSSGSATPAPPPPPEAPTPPPTAADPAVKKKKTQARKKQALAQGRSGTLLGGQVVDDPNKTTRKTLLGT